MKFSHNSKNIIYALKPLLYTIGPFDDRWDTTSPRDKFDFNDKPSVKIRIR